MHYKHGEYIVRHGARGDTFYVIAKGKVIITVVILITGVQCTRRTLYIVHRTPYTVHRTPYTLRRALYTVHCMVNG